MAPCAPLNHPLYLTIHDCRGSNESSIPFQRGKTVKERPYSRSFTCRIFLGSLYAKGDKEAKHWGKTGL